MHQPQGEEVYEEEVYEEEAVGDHRDDEVVARGDSAEVDNVEVDGLSMALVLVGT